MASYAIDKKKIATNTIALYVRTAVSMIISFFAARVTLHQLGVDDYGLNNLVGSVVSMFSFINGSMSTAVQRFYSVELGREDNHVENLKKIFGVGLYLHICVAILTIIIAEIFAVFFIHRLNIPPDRLTAAQIVFQLSLVSLVLNILLVPYSALLRAREDFTQLATADIGQSLLRLGVLFLLIYSSFDKLITLSVLNCIVSIIYVGIIIIIARRYQETHGTPKKDKGIISEMLTFISMLIISLMAQVLKDKGLVMIINVFFGLAVNAAYAVAMQVSHLVSTFVTSFQQSVVPQMMASYGAGDNNNMCKLINVGTKVTIILLLMIALPIMVESKYLLMLWLKTPPEYSPELVSLIMVNIIIFSLEYFLAQGVHATGRLVRLQTSCSIVFLLTIIVMIFVSKISENLFAPMIVNIVCSLIIVVVSLVEAKKVYNYSVRYFIFKIVVPSVLCGGLVLGVLYTITLFFESCLLRTVVVFLGSIVLTIALGFSLLLDQSERNQVLSIVFQKIKKK